MLELASTGAFIVFSVLWWLLKSKDEAQQAQIKLLFDKHDDDARALQELRLQIAQNHYHKVELDARFEKLVASTP